VCRLRLLWATAHAVCLLLSARPLSLRSRHTPCAACDSYRPRHTECACYVGPGQRQKERGGSLNQPSTIFVDWVLPPVRPATGCVLSFRSRRNSGRRPRDSAIVSGTEIRTCGTSSALHGVYSGRFRKCPRHARGVRGAVRADAADEGLATARQPKPAARGDRTPPPMSMAHEFRVVSAFVMRIHGS
jgi:hypothetical protein